MRTSLLFGAVIWRAAELVLEPAKAVAAQTKPDFDPGTAYVVRLQLPLMGIMGTGGGSHDWNFAGIALFGGSIGARFARLVEVEVGATETLSICDTGGSLFARAGLSPSLLRARVEGTHWNLRLPLLLGFLTQAGSSTHTCDTTPSHDLRGMLFSTGLDATHWSPSAFGFNMRLLFSIGPGWSKETGVYGRGSEWYATDKIIEVGLTIGLAFH